MRWSKGFGISLMILTLVGISNALDLPNTLKRCLIPNITELPRNQTVILNWTQITGDQKGAAWYVVDPNRAQVSKWTPRTDIANLKTSGSASTAKLSRSDQTQTILFAKYLIGLDGTITPLNIPDKGQDSTGNGTGRSQTLSPDGQTVAYIDDRYGERKKGTFDEIYRFDLKSGQVRQVSQLGTGRIDSLAWSPDGKSLAFMRQGLLQQIKLDGSNLQKLHQFAEARSTTLTQAANQPLIQPETPLRWSPDGRTIALLGSKDFDRTSATIWLFDVQTRQLRPLFPTPPPRFKDGIHYPFDIDDFVWSPDGQRIVLAGGWGSDARSEWGLYALPRHFLYQVKVDDPKLTQLTTLPQQSAHLVWVQKSL